VRSPAVGRKVGFTTKSGHALERQLCAEAARRGSNDNDVIFTLRSGHRPPRAMSKSAISTLALDSALSRTTPATVAVRSAVISCQPYASAPVSETDVVPDERTGPEQSERSTPATSQALPIHFQVAAA
jgi:hypothetical protein